MHKATPVNAARREKPSTLERYLLEEDRWKTFLVVGLEKNGGRTGTRFCSSKDRNMSTRISEGLNEDGYIGKQVDSCSIYVSLIQKTEIRQVEALLGMSSTRSRFDCKLEGCGAGCRRTVNRCESPFAGKPSLPIRVRYLTLSGFS